MDRHTPRAPSDDETKAASPSPSAARPPLDEASVDPSPFKQFDVWFQDALASFPFDATAMTLATVGPDGRPSARVVLLKSFDERGFVFFTNYESRKGVELRDSPWAALGFHWADRARQVRIEGRVARISAEESDEYFATRPRGSQLGAWASPQSRVVGARDELDRRLAKLTAENADRAVSRPPHWGGLRLAPSSIELWQGRPNRMHDRLRYRLADGGQWVIERLAP
jgi:pyridoxamine 5'-phosphate oxidase